MLSVRLISSMLIWILNIVSFPLLWLILFLYSQTFCHLRCFSVVCVFFLLCYLTAVCVHCSPSLAFPNVNCDCLRRANRYQTVQIKTLATKADQIVFWQIVQYTQSPDRRCHMGNLRLKQQQQNAHWNLLRSFRAQQHFYRNILNTFCLMCLSFAFAFLSSSFFLHCHSLRFVSFRMPMLWLWIVDCCYCCRFRFIFANRLQILNSSYVDTLSPLNTSTSTRYL